jgi:hypothetical protein
VWRLILRSCITGWEGHAPSDVRGAALVDVVDGNAKDDILVLLPSFPSIVSGV